MSGSCIHHEGFLPNDVYSRFCITIHYTPGLLPVMSYTPLRISLYPLIEI
jgi:hypothetical protein